MSLRRLLPLAAALALAACSTQGPPPKPATPPPPPPTLIPPPPAATDWRDLPLSPGGWSYAHDTLGSSASFGMAGKAPDFVIRCLLANRQVTLTRTGGTAGLAIKTSYGERTLPAPAGTATLSASDTWLDQLAFSRARFSVDSNGVLPLMLPAWAEPARVIEDCRG